MAKNKYKIRKILRLLIRNLESKGIEISQLILYGSYAHGKPRTYSDIDIAVVSPSFNGKSILKRQELLGEAIFPLGEPIEALGYTPQECKYPHPMSFISEILTTGRIIYKKSS
jgi:predicted nucleotidyltransferase